MAEKVLAMTVDGRITYCRANPDQRGKGTCKHIAHQEAGERIQEFFDRVVNEEHEITSYKMSLDEQLNLPEITSRKQLEEDLEEGGYISVNEPLWNKGNIVEFSEISGIPAGKLEGLLKDKYVLDEDNNIVAKDKGDKRITGAAALNQLAEGFDYKATTEIYVIPSYMRQSVEGARSSFDQLYSYILFNKTKDVNSLQAYYDRLIDNENVLRERGIRPVNTHGFAIKGLSSQINGKKGLMRKYITGQSVPYAGRCVLEPDVGVSYGEVEIPPEVAAKIFEPTIDRYLASQKLSPNEREEFLAKFKDINDGDHKKETTAFDLARLDNILRECEAVAIVNRQPSLHMGSEIAMKARVSGVKEFVEVAAKDAGQFNGKRVKGRDVAEVASRDGVVSRLKKMSVKDTIGGDRTCVRFSPQSFAGFNADSDGDQCALVAINDPEISSIALNEMSAYSELIRKNPKYQDESLIKPTKDAWYGLQSIFAAH